MKQIKVKRVTIQVLLLILTINLITSANAGIIKDLFQKVTNTNVKTEGLIPQSVPLCGNSIFSTANELNLSPEMIFISNRNTQSRYVEDGQETRRTSFNEVAAEYRFNVDNVTLKELESQGFNKNAPVSILIHGFTSGYPLQGWMTGIVEAYTIDRETAQNTPKRRASNARSRSSLNYQNSTESRQNPETITVRSEYVDYSNRPKGNYNYDSESGSWVQGSIDDGSQDPVATTTSVASSTAKPANGVQKNNQKKSTRVRHNLFIINWNYGARGILYPRAVANIPIVASYGTRFVNKILIEQAAIDSRNIQLIGHSLGAHLAGFIAKNTKNMIGRIYGLDPAGPCFGTYSGFLYPKAQRLAPSDAHEVITIQTNGALLGHEKPLGRYSIFVEGGEKQPGCKGGGILKSVATLTWDNGDFDTLACSHGRACNLLIYNHRDVRSKSDDSCEMVAYECGSWHQFRDGRCGVCDPDDKDIPNGRFDDPLASVRCIRFGLEWQYQNKRDTSKLRLHSDQNNVTVTSTTAAPVLSASVRAYDKDVIPVSMFLRTGDTQPYCTFHYQIVLELNTPFDKRDPPMSIVLQDSTNPRGRETNSLSNDEFGHRLTDRVYTHLLTSVRRLGRVDHATLLFRDGLPQGPKAFKMLHINYMSNINPTVRKRLSTRLCPVIKDESISGKQSTIANTRFFFEPCRART